MREEVG